MKNFKIADINREARYTVTTTDHDDGSKQTRDMIGADLISFTNAAAHLYDIHAVEITDEQQAAADDVLREAVKLDHRVSIYVPSTTDVDQQADNRQQVERVAGEFSRMFGGATATTATGFWQSESAGLVAESTTIVYAACTAEQLEEHLAEVVELARQIKWEMRQEAVSAEIDGTLYII